MPAGSARLRLAVGLIVALSGLVFLGQGLGLIPGSFMTGDPFWAAAGAIMAVVGAALARSGRRRGG